MYSCFECKTCEGVFHNALTTTKTVEELNLIFEKSYQQQDSQYIHINGLIYQINLVPFEAQVFFDIVMKLWQQVEYSTVTANAKPCLFDVTNARKQIVNILIQCRYSLISAPSHVTMKLLQYTEQLWKFILPLTELDKETLKKLLSSLEYPRSPLYCYFHLYLDTQWLLLGINFLCNQDVNKIKYNLQKIMEHIVTLANAQFEKHKSNIFEYDIFPCVCTKQFCLLVHFFIKRLFKSPEVFWEVTDSALNNNKDGIFVIWFMHHMAKLQGFDENNVFVGQEVSSPFNNYSKLETVLRNLLNSIKIQDSNSINNRSLRISLKLIDPLINSWWPSNNSEPYQIYWEYFNKRLNDEDFDVPKTATQLLNKIDKLIRGNGIEDASYEYFLYILYNYLKKHPNQWARIRGRIYSKLAPHKFNEFNDAGVYRISLLFLSLATVVVNLPELSEKLQSLLENLSPERQIGELYCKIQLSLLLLHVREGLSIKTVSVPVMKYVNEAVCIRDNFRTIKLYVEELENVINLSQNFYLGQQVLFSNWINKFILHCQHNELHVLLRILISTVKNVQHIWPTWETIFKTQVLPGLKQISFSSNAPSQIGELAALITLPRAELLNDSIIFFTGDSVTPRITCQFLCAVMNDVNHNIPRDQEICILKAWVRCCLLNTENVKILTKRIYKLNLMYDVFGLGNEESDDSLCDFINRIKCQMSSRIHVIRLKELCEICFGSLDKWICQQFSTSSSETVVLHIYTCIALLFFHCAPLLYDKNKSSCLLNKLITTFMLPTDVLMGRAPQQNVLNSIQKTWHLFFEAIYSLDPTSDAYLDRTLKDLIIRYVPHLSIKNSPILKGLQNGNTCNFILDKFVTSLLTQSCKSADDNVSKTLNLVLTLLENTSSADARKLIVQKMLVAVLEIIMLQTYKLSAVDIIKSIASSTDYQQLRVIVKQSIILVTEKHLAFNANNYFQLVNVLIKLIPTDVESLLPVIKKQVTMVERMRGVGYDNVLRQGLDKLESQLK